MNFLILKFIYHMLRFRRKSHNDVLNNLIKNLDDIHDEDLNDAKELRKNIKDLEAQIRTKNF